MGGRSIAVEPHPASESLGIATSAEDSEERCPVEKAAETERQRATQVRWSTVFVNASPIVDFNQGKDLLVPKLAFASPSALIDVAFTEQ